MVGVHGAATDWGNHPIRQAAIRQKPAKDFVRAARRPPNESKPLILQYLGKYYEEYLSQFSPSVAEATRRLYYQRLLLTWSFYPLQK